jgi:hypothetical protein
MNFPATMKRCTSKLILSGARDLSPRSQGPKSVSVGNRTHLD